MIKIFRKIRYNLMSAGKTSRYLKYAIGEIILVVIGILIALQINNWNQDRKNDKTIHQLYENLQSSLKTDSLELAEILNRSHNSLTNMDLLLTTPSEALLAEYSNEELMQIPQAIFDGVYSFYPKMGIYNQILSSNLMEFIKSEKMKDALRLYYDFRCTRYRALDPIMDEMYHQTYKKFLSEDLKINFFSNQKDPDANIVFDRDLILKFKDETRKLYDLTQGVDGILKELEEDINNLLTIINNELSNN